ncbi:unnamed protein product [Rotaria sp. Silwood1]|nr:unnamed protein product [Rotaria sp. Silwood1]
MLITQFELLPNEILIECFEYLNGIDILNSFGFLNNRYNKLIRNILLHFDCKHVNKSMFHQLCQKIAFDSEIKSQICSLYLSNGNGYEQLSTFSSYISLDQLSNLQTLSLDGIDQNIIWGLIWTLPHLLNLRHFNFTASSDSADLLFEAIPTSTIQSLSMPTMEFDSIFVEQFTSVVSLTISTCSLRQLYEIFKYLPQLKCLFTNKIHFASGSETNEYVAVHLKRLIIYEFTFKFEILENLLVSTPNLESLTILAYDNNHMIDANRWQKLIEFTLSHLNTFKFKFGITCGIKNQNIIHMLQQFQSDFWYQQHHWYTEYSLSEHRALIYTMPYPSNHYIVDSNAMRYGNTQYKIHSNLFEKVTSLKLNVEAIAEISAYYFPNVKSLSLNSGYDKNNYSYPYLKSKHIQSLKMIVHLCKLNHLEILSPCKMKSLSVLLQILQEAPNISSLTISRDILLQSFTNQKLCEKLNKMIKKLDIVKDRPFSQIGLKEIIQACHRFSNIEKLQCDFDRVDDFPSLLYEFEKLSNLKLFSFRSVYNYRMNRWLRDHASELNTYSFMIQFDSLNDEYDDDFWSPYDSPDSVDYDT